MPTYQYACTACDERLEVVQKFSDDPLSVCPACEGRLRKVFSAVGVVFKGSGFYKTDSRASSGSSGKAAASGVGKSDGEASSKTSTADSSSSGGGSASTKSENKAAATKVA